MPMMGSCGRRRLFFATPGRDLANDSLVVGTTLKARLSETVARLGYDCTLQSVNGATDHALSFQPGWLPMGGTTAAGLRFPLPATHASKRNAPGFAVGKHKITLRNIS